MKHPDYYSGRLGNRLFQFAYLYARVREGMIPDWYVQSPEYFKGHELELQELFGDGIGYLEQVGVHVRRASNPLNPDEPKYSENPFYVNLCETDYYERAMALFPDKDFVIFSDDPDYCKERFKGENIQVMERGNDIEDFNILASCESQIIANSSFSWWAAYLNPNPAKKVVAPKRWYSDGEERTKCPESWIRI